jgi:prepilin-type N-terminal cleavage/methylation domain-containing protein
MRRFGAQFHGGFTAIEMMVGMMITSITLAALASFTLSVSAAWKATEAQSEAGVVANIAAKRIGEVIRTARGAGAIREGSLDNNTPTAAVVIWAADTNNDNTIQNTELAMLAHNPDKKQLNIYTPGAAIVSANLTKAQFEDVNLIPTLLTTFDAQPVVSRIAAVRMYRSVTATKAGAVELQLKISRGSGSQVFTVTSIMRGAIETPN